jgi:hypothetical protein
MGFRFNCYNGDFLSKHIDKVRFDTTVKEANRICEHTWSKKKIQESEDFSIPLKMLLYKALVLSILAFGMLIVLVYNQGNDGLLYGAVILICIASGVE